MLPGEIALLAIGVDRLLAGEARWTAHEAGQGQSTAVRARAMPFTWRQAIKRLVAGEEVERPDVPEPPKVIPASVPVVGGAPEEMGEVVDRVLLVLSPVDDTSASPSPVGPIPRDPTATEQMRRDLLWRTVAEPMTVLADASRGGLSYQQLRDMGAAYPEVLATWRELLEAELGRAKMRTPEPKVRAAVSMLMTGKGAAPPPSPAQTPGPPQGKAARPKPSPISQGEATASQKTEGR